ncbi:MAG: hypothetical protein HS127_01315 [Planctomycetia bacterium]|nr:hypothetical protein [Planctomycetia bacterium]
MRNARTSGNTYGTNDACYATPTYAKKNMPAVRVWAVLAQEVNCAYRN